MSRNALSFSRIREAFLDGHYRHWPGEASTLGLHDYDDQLKDLTPEALEDELQVHRQSLQSIRSLDSRLLSAGEALDAHVMSAYHRFHIRTVGENQAHLSNIMMTMYPYNLVQFQRRICRTAEHWEALIARVAQIPRYLKQQEALLKMGAARGELPDKDVVLYIASNQIAHVGDFFEAFSLEPASAGIELAERVRMELQGRCLAAARAYREHGTFLLSCIAPVAEVRTLGEEEYAWRLRHTLGVEAIPEDIISRAREILRGLCARLIGLVETVNGGAVANVQEALAFVMREKQTHLTKRDEDVIAAFRSIHHRTGEHMRAHHLFHIGEEVDQLGFYPMPPAFAELCGASNIAAPLLDPSGKAFFLIHPKAEAHAKIQAAPLSVHEGIPGHGLQSIWWQVNREQRAHTVRFLSVPDEIAMARQYFGAMMNIEGWATYAEVLMEEHDFFTPRETLWATWCKIAHASRVVVDASLHTGRMTVEEGVEFMVVHAGWPREWADGELNRYRQVPLQAVCYLLGRLEILDLRDRCRQAQGDSFQLADFHDRFFAAGPVAAGHLKKSWFAGS